MQVTDYRMRDAVHGYPVLMEGITECNKTSVDAWIGREGFVEVVVTTRETSTGNLHQPKV